eukprot:2715900-Lingulodinium_polyedra.AAC.1
MRSSRPSIAAAVRKAHARAPCARARARQKIGVRVEYASVRFASRCGGETLIRFESSARA